ncbi:MAG: response regulator [Rhodospirillales bacterium]|nr:response regulator [Rhodospirillales bacterium]USO07780.1 MAG: response regulator [Rhodospirillales bacterium]
MRSDNTAKAGRSQLPEMTSQQTFVFESLARTKHSRKRLVVLVAEDQLFTRKLLFTALMGLCEVHVAASGREAWQTFIEIYPDLALLDIDLQDISGHDLARRIKRAAPETFVAMVTANNSVDDVEQARGNRVDGFIVKPFNKAKIMQCLEKCAQNKEITR